MKKMIAAVLAAGLAASCCLTGCGFSASTEDGLEILSEAVAELESGDASVTETETVTYEDVPVTFVFNTGFDVYEFYFTTQDSDDWGTEQCGDYFITDGQEVEGLNVTYTDQDGSFKVKLQNEAGDEYTIENIDMLEAPDPENIIIQINYEEGGDSCYTEFLSDSGDQSSDELSE